MILLFLVICGLASFANAKTSNLIIGGNSTSIASYPSLASIEYQGDPICGGTVITGYHVITAAQCDAPLAFLKVRVGTSLRGHGGSLHRVAAFICHEDFSIRRLGVPVNDIAIVKLQDPVAAYAIRMWDYSMDLYPGAKGTVLGFGIVDDGGPAKWLQVANVPIVSKATCRLIYLSLGGLPQGQICAGNVGTYGKDVCYGDTGGPLIIDQKLAGIVSWSSGCAKKFFPSVYTEIAHYRDWIDERIK